MNRVGETGPVETPAFPYIHMGGGTSKSTSIGPTCHCDQGRAQTVESTLQDAYPTRDMPVCGDKGSESQTVLTPL